METEYGVQTDVILHVLLPWLPVLAGSGRRFRHPRTPSQSTTQHRRKYVHVPSKVHSAADMDGKEKRMLTML